MRLADAGRRDFDELRGAAHLIHRGAAAITHRRAQAAHQLGDHIDHRALVGHAAFDAFGHQLVGIGRRILEVAVGRPLLHRAQRTHAAVGLVRAALEQLDLARRLFGAGQQAAQHDRVGAGRDGLGDIAGVADAAIGDHRHVGRGQRGRHVVDRGDLRHADTGDDARGADRTGADADLDAVGTRVDQCAGRIGRGDVAADHVQMRKGALDPAYAVEHALRMAVRGIDDDHVHAGFGQRRSAFFRAFADADGRADAQPAMRVFRGQRVFGRLQHVLDRDQATQGVVFAEHQHAFEAVAVHQGARFVERGAFMHEDEPLARRHDAGDRLVEIGFETQVAVGHDADHARAVEHRKSGNPVTACQPEQLANRHFRRDGDRILQHAGFEPFHFRHFSGLHLGRHVLVNDAEAAFLGQRNRKTRFADGVHRGGQQGEIDVDVAGNTGTEAYIAWQNTRMCRHEQHIIEGQRLLDNTHDYFPICQKRIIRRSTRLAAAGAEAIAAVPSLISGRSF